MIFTIVPFILNPSISTAKVIDLKICQSYEFHGLLSDELKESPKLSTHAESGLQVDIEIEPTVETSLELLSLKGNFVRAKALVKKKLSSRAYKAEIYFVTLAKPPGLGESSGNISARILKEKLGHSCKENNF